MANQKPINFDALTAGQVTLDTEWYTQRPAGGEPDGNYKGTLRQILARFEAEGLGYRRTVSVSGSATFSVPAERMLQAVVLKSASNTSFSIGTTAGGTQIASGNITGGTPSTQVLWRYYTSATTIHFTGTFTAEIFIR